ncbi:hypothetical protein [Gordonia bronchialis]|uniref:hypothetical protein n=1 Tax=Gordonia bronchialis TaxID=2054 RepID=UPI00226FCB8D|nr:hypothetical protein [Gordonia bronchialis]
MSADHVEVEPAQLWATARALSAINDLSHTTLRDQDGVLATCAAGWATRSAVGYADFTTQLADFTAALSSRLDHLESTPARQPPATRTPITTLPDGLPRQSRAH